ncbi:hypothetical protein F4777DRAFT_543243 [Nemania sp. FL0916]|nr:hypothetical protein F4777DRAFT_543243 [Nemania sp. FL0916]
MADSSDPRIKFGLSCPKGGQFYICQDSPTRFIGCCDVNPCTPERNGECPKSSLFDASFSAASGTIWLPQSCASPFNSSTWYTCTNAEPPFLGCCLNNPCNNGCAAGNLIPATLSEDPKNAEQLLLPITTTATSASPSLTATTSATPSPTATGVKTEGGSNNSRIGVIVGTSLAGVIILLLVIAAYLWTNRRRQARYDDEYEHANAFFDGQLRDAKESGQFSPRTVLVPPSPNMKPLLTPQPSIPNQFISGSPDRSRVSQLSELEGSSAFIATLHEVAADAHHYTDERRS